MRYVKKCPCYDDKEVSHEAKETTAFAEGEYGGYRGSGRGRHPGEFA